jgi:hypothetical protein
MKLKKIGDPFCKKENKIKYLYECLFRAHPRAVEGARAR